MVSRNLGFRFTLVSYNILSQTLLNEHSYLYTSCNPKDLEWPKRGHRIVSELLDNQADIICLQEVECEHLQSLYRPKLARYGYECLYKQKTGYKIDGCAIFYKRNSFRLLNYKGIEFNRTDVTNILNRDNVGIIAVLEPKTHCLSESSQLVIANTHLIFNPKRSDIKLAQLKLFLSELDEISFDHLDSIKGERCHHPTILCGDLNSVPESAVNRFITKRPFERSNLPPSDNDNIDHHAGLECNSDIRGNNQNDSSNTTEQPQQEDNNQRKDPTRQQQQQQQSDEDTEDDKLIGQLMANLSHPFQFRSVYPTKNRDDQPYVSTFSNCIVDYIFYTPRLRLESYRELLTEQQLKSIGPIPNSRFPSDHLTLEAEFVLK